MICRHLKEGQLWRHTDCFDEEEPMPIFIALGEESASKVGPAPDSSFERRSWGVSGDKRGRTWCTRLDTDDLVLVLPEDLSDLEWVAVKAATRAMASKGVKLNPFCGRLYKEERERRTAMPRAG